MKAQNPPQAHLDKAHRIEKYLSPGTTGLIYAIISVSWAVLLSVVAAGLIHLSAVPAAPVTITIFAVLAVIPTAVSIPTWFLRPHDPVSSYIMRLAEMWRTPISLIAELCTFRTVLLSGDILSVQVVFHMPASPKAAELREQIYTFAQAALSTLCSMRHSAPGKADFEAAIEPAIEIVASEHKVPVLYSNVLGVYTISDLCSYGDEALLAAGSLATGTHG